MKIAMNLSRFPVGLALALSTWIASAAGPQFAVDTSWPQPLPHDWQVGQSGGICVDRATDGIWVVNRRDLNKEEVETSTPAPSIMEFDRDGNVIKAFGDESTVPHIIHGCIVDRSHNVWVAGNGDGVVQRWSPDGKLLLQIGTRGKFDTDDGTAKGKPQNSGHDRLFWPSGIAIDETPGEHQGDVYVSDGYGNRRVAVFDKDGKFLRQWGRQATEQETIRGEPGVFQQVVHCIAISNAGLVYVCDRQGNRIEVFHKDGSFVRNINVPAHTGKLPDKRGSAWWVGFSPDAAQKYLYVADGGAEQVHVLDHASGKILSSFGRAGHQAGNFTHGHTLDVDSQGNIYVAETGDGRRVQKFRLLP
jgi:DNA-binding beta-propeller fold protein YncE